MPNRNCRGAKDDHYLWVQVESLHSFSVLQRLEGEKQDIKVQLQKYMKYQKYLEDVLSYNEEYQDPNDIMSRHSTLDANNKELQERKKWLEVCRKLLLL